VGSGGGAGAAVLDVVGTRAGTWWGAGAALAPGVDAPPPCEAQMHPQHRTHRRLPGGPPHVSLLQLQRREVNKGCVTVSM